MAQYANPSRRSVVRGAAWSVPVVAVAATAPAFAASPCTNRTALLPVSWSSLYSTTRQTGSIGGTPVVNVSAGYTATRVGGGALHSSNLAPTRVAETQDSFSLVNTSPTSWSLNPEGNFQTVTFSFTQDVYGLTFSIDDIDRASGYHDHVFPCRRPRNSGSDPRVCGDRRRHVDERVADHRSERGQRDQPDGDRVTYPNGLVPITSLTLRFYSTVGPLASAQHVVRIRQMQLRTCV